METKQQSLETTIAPKTKTKEKLENISRKLN